MAAKRYSAGAIFLQVVPVFANVQRAIEDEAKNIDRALGDQMEKSGDKAGRRAGKAASKGMNEELAKGSGEFERTFHKNIDDINRALNGIDTKKLSNGLRQELTQIKRDLAAIKDVDITVDVDKRRADAAIAELFGRTQALRDGVKIVFRSDIDQALKGFAKIEALKESVEDPIEIQVKVDTAPAIREMGTFEREMKKAGERAGDHLKGSVNKALVRIRQDLRAHQDLRIGIDIDPRRAQAEIAELSAELRAMSKDKRLDIQVRMDAGKAFAELAALQAAIDKVDSDDININVDDKGGLGRVARDGDNASNSFRSFNLILFAAATAGPALVPVLGAIAGGLLAIGPAAAAAAFGLGAVLIGFSGIGGAMQALQQRQDAMEKSNGQMAKTEASTARAVARARQSAADSVESALRRQEDAQRSYIQSVQDVKDAEQALADARKAHANDGQDIANQIAQNQLNIDQGVIDVFDATVNFNAVQADGSASNKDKEQARIDLEQAKLRLKELREEQKKLHDEKVKWDKEGVNGTNAVKTAQSQLDDALDRQKDAYRNLGEAAQAVDKARKEGAQQVADALAAQAEALGSVNAQQANVDAAFSKLGVTGQKFTLFLFGLKQGFYDLRDAIQEAMLPGVQAGIMSFLDSKAAGAVRDALVGMARGFGQFVQALSVSFQGQAWMGFFQMMADVGPTLQRLWGSAFISLMEAFASILTTAAPFAVRFAQGLADMMDAFANWAASSAGQKAITDFLAYAAEVGPEVLAFFGAFARAFGAVAKALAPLGEAVLAGLTGLLNAIANMDPGVLTAIVSGLVILIAASQTAYALFNIINAGAILIFEPLALAVFAIAAIGAALVILYMKNKKFRDFVDRAWKHISAAIGKAWESIKPALENLGAAFADLWHQVLEPLFDWLGPILIWLAEKVIPIWGKIFAFWINNLAFVISDVLVPILHALALVVIWVGDKIFKPILAGIVKGWEAMANGLAWVQKHVIKPAFDAIKWGLDKIGEGFTATVDGIESAWGRLKSILAVPVKFLLKTVINEGIIDGFNAVAGFFGANSLKIDHVQIPKGIQKAYATGGVLPGYTPGRDVHDFYSPTGGRLALSGGEAIMRPEWTAAVGKSGVDYMNQLARTQGVQGIRKAMGFWKGGILPLLGASVRPHKKGQYPGYAADLNVGSGYDDYGMPIEAWKKGIVAQMQYIGDKSYGRWVVLNHGGGQNSLYAHMSQFGPEKVGDTVKAGQMIGRVGDLGNTGTPPTSHLHFEIRGGAANYADNVSGGGKILPGWLRDIIGDPLGAVKNWATKPWKTAAETVTNNPLFPVLKKAPLLIAEKVTDKLWDIVPGWAKTAVGWAGDAADWAIGGIKSVGGAAADAAHGVGHGVSKGVGAVGDFLGLKDGGILPYNGTMMYDNGGYLPPGITQVVNMTGKPEPVFTHDQWGDVQGGAGGGETYHYEPHFEGSNLTSEDVGGDMNFQMRRLRRKGKYGKPGA